jgi:hypothetical protein
MTNKIKKSGTEGLALQITKPARAAELVEENSDGDATYRADVRVYAFSHLLLIVDIETVSTRQIAELVAAAARDTKSIYRAVDASIQTAGNGYQVQLPPAREAGFQEGDRAPCHTGRSVLIISNNDGTSAGTDAARLAQDLITIRNDQLSNHG